MRRQTETYKQTDIHTERQTERYIHTHTKGQEDTFLQITPDYNYRLFPKPIPCFSRLEPLSIVIGRKTFGNESLGNALVLVTRSESLQRM